MLNQILNLSGDIGDITNNILNRIDIDIFSRKPRVKVEDEKLYTDLDLSTIMQSLAKRRAVVNIPSYQRRRPKCKDGKILLDPKNRHGILTSLSSNQNTFSFSMRIIDQQVVDSEKPGHFRSFLLTDLTGDLYSGWQKIDFFPVEEENKFLNETNIWSTIKAITIKNFVHPSRWRSFFSNRYFLTKCLIHRLEEENRFLNQELKRLQELGVPYPKIDGEDIKSKTWPKKEEGKYKTVKVQCLQVLPELTFSGEFTKYKEDTDSYLAIWNKRKKNRFHILPKLRYYTRCCELSLFKKINHDEDFFIREGFEDYKPPRKRITWKKFHVSEKLSLLTRLYFRSEKISEEETI